MHWSRVARQRCVDRRVIKILTFPHRVLHTAFYANVPGCRAKALRPRALRDYTYAYTLAAARLSTIYFTIQCRIDLRFCYWTALYLTAMSLQIR